MNGFGRFMTKAFLGNTTVGQRLLGESTDLEMAAERIGILRQAQAMHAALEARQIDLDHKAAEAYARGQRHSVNPYVVADELLGVPVFIQFYGNNDPTKMDIFYGGDQVPDGEGHGHITIRRGVIDTWLLPADAKGYRERFI